MATACAAMPSPRPVNPRRSVVVALMLILAGGTRNRAASDARIETVRTNSGRLADQGDVDMVDTPASRLDQRSGMLDERGGSGATPLRVAGRKMIADVAGADRPEQGVGERVEQDIGVAMPGRGRDRWE